MKHIARKKLEMELEAELEQFLQQEEAENKNQGGIQKKYTMMGARRPTLMYIYQIPKCRSLENMFKIHDKKLKAQIASFMNSEYVKLTKQQQFFLPHAEEQFSSGGQRTMYYSTAERMLFQENQHLVQFKVYCKLQGKALPDIDEELLRHLYCCNHDPQTTYESILRHQKFMQDSFPMTVTHDIHHLLEIGITYVCGRDKNLRPVLVVNLGKLWNVKPFPSVPDITAMFVLYF